jgi:hypothetical protein
MRMLLSFQRPPRLTERWFLREETDPARAQGRFGADREV